MIAFSECSEGDPTCGKQYMPSECETLKNDRRHKDDNNNSEPEARNLKEIEIWSTVKNHVGTKDIKSVDQG